MVMSSWARSAKEVAAHTGAAAAAAASRASTAAASKGSNDSTSSPVAGFTTAIGGPGSEGLIVSVSPTSLAGQTSSAHSVARILEQVAEPVPLELPGGRAG